MSVFSTFGCLFNRHQPSRRHVVWDGRAYVGSCKNCGRPIQRHGKQHWRARKVDKAGLPPAS